MIDKKEVKQFESKKDLMHFGEQRVKDQREVENSMRMGFMSNIDIVREFDMDDTSLQMSEVPQQEVDEKEEKEKRKQRKQRLSEGLKQINKVNKERLKKSSTNQNRQIESSDNLRFFEESIDFTIFTPDHLLEHLPEVWQTMERWKAKLLEFSLDSDKENLLKKEAPQFWERLSIMNRMYEAAEMVFSDALHSMGFSLEQQKNGAWKLRDSKRGDQEQEKKLSQTHTTKLKDVEAELLDYDISILREQYQKENNSDVLEDQNNENPFLKQKGYRDNFLNFQKMLFSEENQEKYNENKQDLDILYEEYQHVIEVLSTYADRIEENNNIRFGRLDYQKTIVAYHKRSGTRSDSIQEVSEQVKATLEKENKFYKEASELLNKRAMRIRNLVRYYLKGETRSYEDVYLLRSIKEKGIEAAPGDQGDMVRVRLLRRKEDIFVKLRKKDAYRQVKFSEQEKAICISLMDEENMNQNEMVLRGMKEIRAEKSKKHPDTKVLGNLVKQYFYPFIDQIKEFDLLPFGNYSKETLLENNEQLQRMGVMASYIGDLVKYTDFKTNLPISHGVFKDSPRLFMMKAEMIKNYADLARYFTLLNAKEKGTLTNESFLPEESLLRDGSASIEDHMYMDIMENIDRTYKTGFNSGNPDSEGIDFEHDQREVLYSDTKKKFDDALKKAGEMLKTTQMKEEDVDTAYWNFQEQIEEKESQLKVFQNSKGLKIAQLQQMEELQREVLELREQAELLEIYRFLPVDSMLKRKFKNVPLPIRQMEEEILNIMRNLSAGFYASQKEGISDEELLDYHKKNEDGIQAYMALMKIECEAFENKYHHEIPSLEYLEEHLNEFQNDYFAMKQDMEIIDYVQEFFAPNPVMDDQLMVLVQKAKAFLEAALSIMDDLHQSKDYTGNVNYSRIKANEALRNNNQGAMNE